MVDSNSSGGTVSFTGMVRYNCYFIIRVNDPFDLVADNYLSRSIGNDWAIYLIGLVHCIFH